MLPCSVTEASVTAMEIAVATILATMLMPKKTVKNLIYPFTSLFIRCTSSCWSKQSQTNTNFITLDKGIGLALVFFCQFPNHQ